MTIREKERGREGREGKEGERERVKHSRTGRALLSKFPMDIQI